jgi:hypothetical protein
MKVTSFFSQQVSYHLSLSCTINFSDPVDKARHDRMVAPVTQMPDLNMVVSDRQG